MKFKEKKEKENFEIHKLKSNSTIKAIGNSKILGDIAEEADIFGSFGGRSSLKITKTTSLSKQNNEEFDGSMVEVSSEESFDQDDEPMSPTKKGLEKPTITRKASLPDLTMVTNLVARLYHSSINR